MSSLPSPRWGEGPGVRGGVSNPSPPTPLPAGERGEEVPSPQRGEGSRLGEPMKYAFPNLIGLSAVAAGLAVLAAVALVRKRRALRRLAALPTAGPLVAVSRSLQAAKALLTAAAGLLLAVVLLGPQWGRTAA